MNKRMIQWVTEAYAMLSNSYGELLEMDEDSPEYKTKLEQLNVARNAVSNMAASIRWMG